jgi:hypothetical protein
MNLYVRVYVVARAFVYESAHRNFISGYLLPVDIVTATVHNQHGRRTVRTGLIIGAFIVFILIAQGFINIATLNLKLICSSIRTYMSLKSMKSSTLFLS